MHTNHLRDGQRRAEENLPIVEEALTPAPSWRRQLAEAVRDPDLLCDLLDLPEFVRQPARRAADLFPLVVPMPFLARIKPGDVNDPLLRQVLPIELETQAEEGYVSDPVGDRAAQRAPGMLQKYQGRALLITHPVCAVHCRYCFRREFPYPETPRGMDDWRPALDEIDRDDSMDEVILSGGDPLSAPDTVLARLVDRLGAIKHLRRLRIHTRWPIVIPDRVTGELLSLLQRTRLTAILVVHVNHVREIDDAVALALGRLIDHGVPVLNQSVLLRGVNDDVESLACLSRRLVELRVMPYYLHQLDRVRGAAHFEVPIEKGKALIEGLRARLPGYAVPRYVMEQPGAAAKTSLCD